MLQDFRRRTTPETGAPRLGGARGAMAEAGVDAFLVPRADAHQGENVAPRDERLAWLTGFTGSAGLALVTAGRAAIFVDGRYRLQVRGQVDLDCFEVRRASPRTSRPTGWPRRCRAAGGSASTPGCTPRRRSRRSRTALGPRQIGLVRVDEPRRPGLARPAAAAGRADRAAPGRARRARPRADKRAEIARGLVERDLSAAVLTLPDSIAWLLNVRGSDIARTPVPLAFAILHADGRVDALLRSRQGRRRAAGASRAGGRWWRRPEAFGPALDALRGRVAVDKASAPVWVVGPARRRRRGGGGLGARPLHPAEGDARPRPRSPAPAPRTCATGRRWPSSSPGSTPPRPRAG